MKYYREKLNNLTHYISNSAVKSDHQLKMGYIGMWPYAIWQRFFHTTSNEIYWAMDLNPDIDLKMNA